jgi:hypothetical protein
MRNWTIRIGVAQRMRWTVVAMFATVVVACGGGGGGGGGSGSMAPPVAVAPAGVSVGAITGFGSVHVNGKKFQTTSATIHVDGQASTQAELHVGDVIEVRGHHDASSNTDVADVIEAHSNVIGPVGSIDVATQHVVVLGQSVAVSATTSFGDGISPATLAGIAVGDVLRVSGMVAVGGEIQATRIERRPAGTPYRVTGTAAGMDTTAKTLMINALVVDYSAATLSDFAAGGPADGQLVEALGTTLGSAGQLRATRIELRSGKELKGEADAASEIEGLVTRFASATDFDVGGRAVSTSSSTRFDGGAAADLALNVSVEVEGALDAGGVLVATRVRIEKAATAALVAQVDSVDAANGVVHALGATVTVDGMTRFEDHGAQKVNTFSLADVHTGDWIEVRGTENPAGTLLAARFERKEAQSAVRLAGAVHTVAQPAMTILAASVATTNTTSFTDATGHSTTASAFFAVLPGPVVSVNGSWDGTTLTASSASLAHDEGH